MDVVVLFFVLVGVTGPGSLCRVGIGAATIGQTPIGGPTPLGTPFSSALVTTTARGAEMAATATTRGASLSWMTFFHSSASLNDVVCSTIFLPPDMTSKQFLLLSLIVLISLFAS